jgi:ATP-dependent Lon protease
VRGVILPARNQRDLTDVPEETRNALQWRPVTRIDEVLEIALSGSQAREPVSERTGPEAATEDIAARPRR